jgi:hypothetical protein
MAYHHHHTKKALYKRSWGFAHFAHFAQKTGQPAKGKIIMDYLRITRCDGQTHHETDLMAALDFVNNPAWRCATIQPVEMPALCDKGRECGKHPANRRQAGR